MLKTRLIPALFLKNGLIVRSEGFSYHQNLGNPISEAKRYSDWDVDELVYIDISREKTYDMRRDDHRVTLESGLLDILTAISKVCFMPLTFGGGIRTLDDVAQRVRRGADKVTLNTAALEDPSFITKTAEVFGSQAVVVSVDYKAVDGAPRVFKGGVEPTGLDPVAWAAEAERRGAGEIFLNAMDRDGKGSGYDLAVIRAVCAAVNIPVIACGGAGTFDDFVEVAQETPVSAVAAGNIFHFTELAYPKAKRVMLKNGIQVRSP
jgi:cyclase